MKYNVGDVVKVKPDAQKHYDRVSEMGEYIGKSLKITRVIEDDGFGDDKVEGGYRLEGSVWKFYEDMLESVTANENETVKFVRGELVEVSDEGTHWEKRIFLAEIEGAYSPVMCVSDGYENEFMEGRNFAITKWKHVRKIVATEPKELTVKEISELLGYEVRIKD